MLLYFVSVVCVYKDILTDMSHYSLCIYIHTHKDIYTHKGMCNQGLKGMGRGGGIFTRLWSIFEQNFNFSSTESLKTESWSIYWLFVSGPVPVFLKDNCFRFVILNFHKDTFPLLSYSKGWAWVEMGNSLHIYTSRWATQRQQRYKGPTSKLDTYFLQKI